MDTRLSAQPSAAAFYAYTPFPASFPLQQPAQASPAPGQPVPLQALQALDQSFAPLAESFREASGRFAPQGGLLQVTLPSGAEVLACHGGQPCAARHTAACPYKTGLPEGQPSVTCCPTELFMALVLLSIEAKLPTIRQLHQHMLAEYGPAGDQHLAGMGRILEELKQRLPDLEWRRACCSQVAGSRTLAAEGIRHCSAEVRHIFDTAAAPHSDHGVARALRKLTACFPRYRLEVYRYTLASFLEILLGQNFQSAAIGNAIYQIEDYAMEYRALYSHSSRFIEGYSRGSLQSRLAGTLAHTCRQAGGLLPRSGLERKLAEAGRALEEANTRKSVRALAPLIARQSSYVNLYVEDLKTIERICNSPLVLLFDAQNLYIRAQ